MIAFISGKLEEINSGSIIVESSGVGYEILIYDSYIRNLISEGKLHQDVKIVTYLDVKEDSLRLYGFPSYREKKIFKQLLSVNGVGPKGAQSILNELGPDNLLVAIAANDYKAISKSNGIGAKTAQKIVLELKDKVDSEGITFEAIQTETSEDSNISDAAQALCSLGYTNTDALKAIKHIEGAESMKVEEIIKSALKYL